MTGRAGRSPQQIQRDRDRSRAWHARQRELAALATVASTPAVSSPARASGRGLDRASGPLQPHPDVERLVELERRVVELEARDAAREAELIELRAYRQRDRDRSRRNSIRLRQTKSAGTATVETGTPDQRTGSRAGASVANSARASRAPATGGLSGRVNNSGGGGGVSRARSAAPAPPVALPVDDETLLDRLWATPRVLAVLAQRGLNPEWERANFERKPQGRDPGNWTIEYLVAWLLRSTVQVPDPTPISRATTDREPRQDQRVAAACASSAYLHDPWAGRRPPIAEADLVRGGAL